MRKLLLGSLAFLSFGLAGEVDQFLDSLGVSLSSGSSVEAQTRGYYFGGGASYRAPSAVLQPFQVVPPSINAGCGGIDLTFGSFSYLNPEYFVEFAKKVIAQAPGFAFDIALDIMCPQCSSIMKRLTSLSNQINAMSLNSCRAMANLSNWVRSEVLNINVAEGGSDSWLKAVDSLLSSWNSLVGEFNRQLANAGCTSPNCYLFAGYRSIADRFVGELSSVYPYWNTANMKYFIRALFGDVIRKGSSPPYTYVCIQSGQVKSSDITRLAEADPLAEPIVELPGYDDDGNFRPVQFSTIRAYVHTTLSTIISKIINKQPLTSSELEFLAGYDIPALGLLRILSPSPSALLAIQSDLERYLAYELTYQFIAQLHTEYTKLVNKASNLIKEAPDMEKEAAACAMLVLDTGRSREFLEDLKETVDKKKQSIAERIRLAIDIYEMERIVYSKFSRHPLMASYMFGNVR